MAVTWSLNLTPATGSEAIFNLKAALKLAGWTVVRSGSGSGGSTTTSDLITTAGSGVGGMANTSAWFVIQQPSGGRQLMFYRGSDTAWWVQYSFSAGFSGGSPSATVPATASDAVNLLGTGTGGTSTLFSTNNTYRQNIMADGSSPYGFYSFCFPTGGGVINSLIFMDPLTSTPSDADPYAFMCSGKGSVTTMFPVAASSFNANNAFQRTDLTSNTGCLSGYLKKGLAGEGFVCLAAACYYFNSAASTSVGVPGNMGTNPNNSSDDQYPVIYGRNNNTVGSGTALTAPTGYKGVSTLLRWMGTNRVTGDLLTVSATGDRVVVDGAATLPWNSGVTPTV